MAVDVAGWRRRVARDNEHHADRDGSQRRGRFIAAMGLSTMRAASVGVICESKSARILQLF
jgi:hypothetical protein